MYYVTFVFFALQYNIMFIKVNFETEWPRGGRQDPAGAGWNPD